MRDVRGEIWIMRTGLILLASERPFPEWIYFDTIDCKKVIVMKPKRLKETCIFVGRL